MNLTVTCDRNGGAQDVTLLVRLGAGLNGTTSTRRMARAGSPPDYLAYGLYRDVNRTSTWGATDDVDILSQTLSIPNRDSRSAEFTVYARVPAGQDVAAGSYSDNVQITILY
jgi:spore coat protein U-like protein